MKTDSFSSHYVYAPILKAVGVVLILGTLVDYIMLAVPPDFLNSQWLVNLISEWVGRGSVPLLGLAIVFLGVWLDRSDTESNSLKGLPTLALMLSVLLGVLFLVMAPLYFNSSRLTSAAQTRQINQQAAQAERQLNNLLAQRRERVNAIVSDEAQLSRLEQELESLKLPEEQQAQLREIQETLDKVKSDPKALDQEVAKVRTQGQTEIQDRQKAALSQLQSEMRRDRLHITLSSLIFALGYLLVGWTGLGGTRSKPRRSAARAR